MKITKEYLKQLIIEQMEQQEQPEKSVKDEKGMGPQELKKTLLKMAVDVAGIMQNEMDVVEFALSIVNAAKNKNLNNGVLRQRLEIVKKEMENIKS